MLVKSNNFEVGVEQEKAYSRITINTLKQGETRKRYQIEIDR